MFAFFLSTVGHSRSRSLQIAIKLFGSFHLSVGLVGQEITGREELRLVRDGSGFGDPSLLLPNSKIHCTHCTHSIINCTHSITTGINCTHSIITLRRHAIFIHSLRRHAIFTETFSGQENEIKIHSLRRHAIFTETF
jgi:hypothetical protein